MHLWQANLGRKHPERFEANLRPALDLLAEVVLRPTFPADGVLEERALQIAAVKRAFDSAVQRPQALAYAALWPTHPYGLPGVGTEESVGALDAPAVAAWWRDHLAAEFHDGAQESRSGRIRVGHGHRGTASMPVVSGRPSIRFIDCTACPAPPLTRLSSALVTTS